MNLRASPNRASIALLVSVIVQATALGQADPQSPEFAASLMAEGDYFRAIGEYKRLLFYSVDDSLDPFYAYQISRAYQKSGHFLLSISYLDTFMKRPEIEDDLLVKGDLLYGINFFCLHQPSLAAGYFRKAQLAGTNGSADLLLGLLFAEGNDWEGANQAFLRAAGKADSAQAETAARELAASVLKGPSIDRRSPVLAGILSAIVPGSGQAYSGHWVDAANAFGMVGVFGFATFLAYSYESQQNGGRYVYTAVAGGITAVFHVSNILGAIKTAQYYSAKKKQDFMDGLKSKVMERVE